jgi:hypothetical protein
MPMKIAVFVGLPTKIGSFSSAADENKAIFIGYSGRRKYPPIFVGLK